MLFISCLDTCASVVFLCYSILALSLRIMITYIYIYTCMYVCIHLSLYISIYIYISIYTYRHNTYTYLHIHLSSCSYVSVYASNFVTTPAHGLRAKTRGRAGGAPSPLWQRAQWDKSMFGRWLSSVLGDGASYSLTGFCGSSQVWKAAAKRLRSLRVLLRR